MEKFHRRFVDIGSAQRSRKKLFQVAKTFIGPGSRCLGTRARKESPGWRSSELDKSNSRQRDTESDWDRSLVPQSEFFESDRWNGIRNNGSTYPRVSLVEVSVYMDGERMFIQK